MERRSERTGRYRYLAVGELFGDDRSYPRQAPTFELTDFAAEGMYDHERAVYMPPARLRPRTAIFSSYQQSLTHEQQAVLASCLRLPRWRRAGESGMETDVKDDTVDVDHRLCLHPPFLHTRYSAAEEADVEDGGSESEDEKRPTE